MRRRRSPSPLPDPKWGRKWRGGLLHVWRDGTVYGGAKGYEEVPGRISLCGLSVAVGPERPSKRGRRCKICAAKVADPRDAIGRKLAARWPRALSSSRIREIAPQALREDRLDLVMGVMESDHLATRNEVKGRGEVWTARRALVEKHGGVYGWRS